MTESDIEWLQRLDLEKQLNFCREKNKELEAHITGMCEYRDSYDDMFKSTIRTLEFQALRYHDEDTYKKCAQMKKMYNMFKFILDKCK